jgi:hypothetical protein
LRRGGRYEQYREAWDLLKEGGEIKAENKKDENSESTNDAAPPDAGP